jgi:hypothetical protein
MFGLVRSLLAADAVTAEAVGRALFLSATRRVSVDQARLEEQLERVDTPSMRHIAPVTSLVQSLPPGLCERLLALPVRCDPRTGTVDVAVVDARDTHAADEISYWLKAPVRVVRTSMASMEGALRRIESTPDPGMRPLAAPMGAPPEPGDWNRPEEVGTGPNIPIPLTRRSFPPLSPIEIALPVIEKDSSRTSGRQRELTLDLNRRKSIAPASSDESSRARSTQRGPFAPPPAGPAPEPEPVSAVVEKMQRAHDRDRILALLISGVEAVARCAVVLAVRREAIVGWAASRSIEDASLRSLRIPISMRTALNEGLEHPGVRHVRLPDDEVHAPLAALLRVAHGSYVAVAAVRVDEKPAAVVVAADLVDPIQAMSRMADLAPAAGESLARLLRERRK